MRRGKRGFTLIEVAIFLAVTGALFVSVAVGVQNSVYQQRTNDSVQNFIEFLRSAYAQVTDVQNTGSGRSEKAIYGKLITMGERYNLAGDELENNSSEMFMYTVVGDIADGSGDVLTMLKDLNATVVREVQNERDTESSIVLAGIAESYTPKWAAEIEPACDGNLNSCSFEPMRGSILIVRHPNSGTVSTFWSPDVIEVNEAMRSGGGAKIDIFAHEVGRGFRMEQIDFCMNTVGEDRVSNRADIRIIKGAKNASGIELVGSDTEGYKCGR